MFRDPWQQHHQQQQQQQHQHLHLHQHQPQLRPQHEQHHEQKLEMDNRARWDYNMAVRRFSLPTHPHVPPQHPNLDAPANYMRYMDGSPSLGSDGFVIPSQPSAPHHNYYDVRRMSHPAVRTAPQPSRRRDDHFGDAASVNAVAMGMVAMAGSRPSNTPSASDPSGHSSSISYLGDTDEDERRESALTGVIPGGVEGQASMMSTFHSKTSTQSQKKHKCPVCWKRFTRPSSLATHILSHTGERPFACDYDGCGRKFSVVSNLRRHKRIHAQSV